MNTLTDEEYRAVLTALEAKAVAIGESSTEDLKESFLIDDRLVLEYELEQTLERHPDYERFDLNLPGDLYLRFALAARRRGIATTDLLAESVIEVASKWKERSGEIVSILIPGIDRHDRGEIKEVRVEFA